MRSNQAGRGGGGIPRRARRGSAQRRVAGQPRAGAEGRRPRRRRARSAAPRAARSIRATPARTTTSRSSPTRAATRRRRSSTTARSCASARSTQRRAGRPRPRAPHGTRRLARGLRSALRSSLYSGAWPTRSRTPRSTISSAKTARFRRRPNSARSAIVRDESIYAEAARDPEAFWATLRRRARMVAAVGHGARLAAAARQVVRRRQAQRQRQLPRSPRPRTAPQQGRAHLGRRAGRSPHADLLRSVSRGVRVRQRAEVARRRRKAIASRSTCRSFPSSRSRCSPARASAPSTASSSAASAPSRCAIASTTRQCRLLITADGGYRRGQIVPLKQVADEALAGTPSIEHVVVVQRGGAHDARAHQGRPRSLVSPS